MPVMILVIKPGSTSTKISLFSDVREIIVPLADLAAKGELALELGRGNPLLHYPFDIRCG